jgi:phage terminase large subunit GpA-like protein
MVNKERELGPIQLTLFETQLFSGPDRDILSYVLDLNDESTEASATTTRPRPWSDREFEAWTPPDSTLVSEWAAKHRVLSPQFSAFPGTWEHRAHYAIEIMDAFLDPMVEEITLKAPAQSVKTDAVYNMLGYTIDQDPAPVLVVMPTLLTLGRVNERIKNMIESTPALARHLTGNEDDLTAKKIQLDNMPIYFATAGSSADLRNVLARIVILDEKNDYPESTGRGSQGSPSGQAKKRARTFWNKKILNLCTPTIEDGEISIDYERSDRSRYWVPCPHCRGYQVLAFSRIKHVGCELGAWPKDKRSRDHIIGNAVARYECEHCNAEIEEKHKSWMDMMGTWVPEGHPIEQDGTVEIPRPRSSHRGFAWQGQITPFLTWSEMAAEFFESKDNLDDLKVFRNLTEGVEWKEATVARAGSEILALRTERPPLVCPSGTVAITAGIDNQKYGKWVVLRAWTRDGRAIEGHLIRHGFVASFDELEQWIFEDVYGVEGSDIVLPVWRGGIDIGGSEGDDFRDETMTEEVYEWLRAMGRGVMFGVKGSSRTLGGGKKMRSSIIDRMPSRGSTIGKPIPGGLKLWLLDTSLIKNAIWSRIETGKFHLHADVDNTYAKHLISEQKEKTRQGKTIWKLRGHGENHLFDAEVYAAAMADPECDGGVMVLRPPSPSYGQDKERAREGQSHIMLQSTAGRRINPWSKVGRS